MLLIALSGIGASFEPLQGYPSADELAGLVYLYTLNVYNCF